MKIATMVCVVGLAIGCNESTSWTGATLTVTGAVSDFTSRAPIAGAQVCVYYPQTSPKACTTTAANGTYSLPGVPAGTEEMISVTAAGYVSLLQMGTMTASNSANVNGTPPTIGAANAIGTVVSVEADLTTKGHVVFITDSGNGPSDGGPPMNTADVTASLSSSAAKGPFYANAAGVPDTSLTKTSAAGFGAFLNIPPGDYDLTFTPPAGKTCTPIHAWSNGKPNGFKVRIAAGFITGAITACK